jgi:hypothetical protein
LKIVDVKGRMNVEGVGIPTTQLKALGGDKQNKVPVDLYITKYKNIFEFFDKSLNPRYKLTI